MDNKSIDKKIKQIIDIEIMKDLNNKNFNIAHKKLLKIYMQYYDKVKIDAKWSVLYRLIYTEHKLGHSDIVKIYTEVLKKDMDKIENEKYRQVNKGKYADVLRYYIDTHKDLLSDEEITNLYRISYKAYEKYINEDDGGNFLCMINSKFNLYLKLNDEDIILEIIKKVSSLHSIDKKIILKEMLESIKNKDLNLYKKSKLLFQ